MPNLSQQPGRFESASYTPQSNSPAGSERPKPNHVVICNLFTRWSGVVSFLAGSLVLGEWVFRAPTLTSVFLGLATMKPLNAVCFTLVGASLWLVSLRGATGYPSSGSIRIAGILCSVLCAISFFTLIEYVSDLAPAFDEILFRKTLNATPLQHPGRMSSATAFGLLLLGISLLSLTRRKSNPYVAQILGLITSLIGLISIVGHLYGINALYSVPAYSTMAIHTAALLFVSS